MSSTLRVVFVGESWLGSCARSFKEALARNPSIEVDEVSDDHYFPKHRARWLRGIHRLLGVAYRRELYEQILLRVKAVDADVVVVYKGYAISPKFIRYLRSLGVQVVNVYPDYSPHAYGVTHREAVGEYDLVISTKPFHVSLWKSTYGYSNACEFVPQGYDPELHLLPTPAVDQPVDVALVATWRSEYGDLMKRLAVLLNRHAVTVAIAGNGWLERRHEFPAHWIFETALSGQAYLHWLRRGKICIAPVTREVAIDGGRQPGDEDSTRTYELAAARCFFIHRRTRYVETLYDESEEVPLYDTAEDLASKILYFLNQPAERAQMALRAHRRAVPDYSLDSRVERVVEILRRRLGADVRGTAALKASRTGC